MNCRYCGRSSPEGKPFCPYCGRKVEVIDNVTPVTAPGFHRAGDLNGEFSPVMPKNESVSTEHVESSGLCFSNNLRKSDETPGTTTPVTPAHGSAKTSAGNETYRGATPPPTGKYCPKCRKPLDIDAKFCHNCGQKVETTPVEKRKLLKPILIAAACALLAVVIVLIYSISGPKSTNEIVKDVEEYFPFVYVEKESVPVSVDSIEIEDRKTRDDTDEVYCKVNLESDSFKTTAFLLLNYSKYNRNDWRLEYVTSYAPEQVEITKDTASMRNEVISSVQQKNEIFRDVDSLIDSESAICVANNVQYSFQISDYSGIKNTSGTVLATLTMSGDCQDGYLWYVNVDDSDVETWWNVEGTWECYKSAYLCSYELEITIYSLSDDAIDCYWTYAYRDRSGLGLSDFSSGDGADCWVAEADNEKIKIAVHYGSALLSVDYIYFYADGTAEVDFGYDGTGEMERTY